MLLQKKKITKIPCEKGLHISVQATHLMQSMECSYMHSCGENFLTYRYPYRNIMSWCAGGSKEGHRNLCKWAKISKLGKRSLYMTPKNKYLACKPNKKLGRTGCNMIALCKAGAVQINSHETFNSCKFNWSLQLFLIREKVEMSSLVTEAVRQTHQNIHQWQFL